jgi:AraC-like DNA-binding protein
MTTSKPAAMKAKARPKKAGAKKKRNTGAAVRPKAGQPEYEATDETRAYVQRQRLAGDTHELLAAKLKISEPTLRKHFHYELEHSTSDLMGNIAASVYQAALGGNVAAAMFALRTKGGWVERKELTGADGAPLIPAGAPPLLLVQFVDPDSSDESGG